MMTRLKKLLTRVLQWLNAIPKDKYQHDALGSRIATWSFVFAILLVWLAVAVTTAFWIAIAVSVVSTAGWAVWKDCAYDAESDWRDILATIIGGFRFWVAVLVLYFIG